ncbi:MAG: hypothetical protein ACYC1L_04340 [Alphaproteobacteria bacterium]
MTKAPSLQATCFFNFTTKACWICGSPTKPTREHKYKATDLRRRLGSDHMIVVRGKKWKLAQSDKSNHVKFKSTICEECNTATTQRSDKAYDAFIEEIEKADINDDAVKSAAEKFLIENETLYLPTFRYFAKLLGCHLADIKAPIPNQLANFVACKSERNCIWLNIRVDQDYKETIAELPDFAQKRVAHGGLIVITKKPNFFPTKFYSTLTIGAIQFMFFYELTHLEIRELQFFFKDFASWCAEKAQATIEDDDSLEHLARVGLPLSQP